MGNQTDLQLVSRVLWIDRKMRFVVTSDKGLTVSALREDAQTVCLHWLQVSQTVPDGSQLRNAPGKWHHSCGVSDKHEHDGVRERSRDSICAAPGK